MPIGVFAGGGQSHWGVDGSPVATWKSHETMRKLIVEGDGVIKGSELTIGFVRGSTSGGDWGVSFVQKPFKDGLISTHAENNCETMTGPSMPSIALCSSMSERTVVRQVALRGAEYHFFRPFGTIRNRVQIGMNVAAGAATFRGTVEDTFDSRYEQNGQLLSADHFVEAQDAAKAFFKVMPLLKLEAMGGIVVTPALKIKLSGGLNFPSANSFRIGVVYLIGAR